jgi:hypothetical protein
MAAFPEVVVVDPPPDMPGTANLKRMGLAAVGDISSRDDARVLSVEKTTVILTISCEGELL